MRVSHTFFRTLIPSRLHFSIRTKEASLALRRITGLGLCTLYATYQTNKTLEAGSCSHGIPLTKSDFTFPSSNDAETKPIIEMKNLIQYHMGLPKSAPTDSLELDQSERTNGGYLLQIVDDNTLKFVTPQGSISFKKLPDESLQFTVSMLMSRMGLIDYDTFEFVGRQPKATKWYVSSFSGQTFSRPTLIKALTTEEKVVALVTAHKEQE